MTKVQEQTDRQKIVERLMQVIVAIRVPLLVGIAVIAAGLLFYFIYTEVGKNTRKEATSLAEKAAEKYTQWQAEEDEQKKSVFEKKLMSDLDVIIRAYPQQYASQRAIMLRGNIEFENKQWKTAADDFLRLSESFPNSYLGGEALFKAAICREELGEIDTAIEHYNAFIAVYVRSPRIPHALFSVGRLQEEKSAYAEAQAVYSRLKLDYTASNWTNLAVNRIIALKYQGKIAE